MEFEIIRGDIVDQRANALVNAAGTSLRMGSGVAGALRRGANGPINEAAVSKGPVELGEVAVTDAYELNADYVIHAAAMPHYGDGRATAESVRDATRNALETAEDIGCESIVVPILGTGAAGLDIETGAHAVCEEIQAYESTTLTDVRVIAYSQSEYQTVREIADRLRSVEK